MGRAIVSYANSNNAFPKLAAPGTPPPPLPPDTYRDRLLKYIPAEVVTLYLGLCAIASAAPKVPEYLGWVIFAVGVLGTPYYLRAYLKVTAPTQLIISTLSFLVWVFAIGGPFKDLAWYKDNQIYAALLLPVFTFVVAGITPEPTEKPGG